MATKKNDIFKLKINSYGLSCRATIKNTFFAASLNHVIKQPGSSFFLTASFQHFFPFNTSTLSDTDCQIQAGVYISIDIREKMWDPPFQPNFFCLQQPPEILDKIGLATKKGPFLEAPKKNLENLLWPLSSRGGGELKETNLFCGFPNHLQI